VKYDEQYLLAELKEGGLIQIYLCDKRPNGKFYAAHEKVKGKWIKPKDGTKDLWPVLLTLRSVAEMMPFRYEMSRDKMTSRFKEHAKKLSDLLA
jgi:hypothetical protein